MREPTLIELCDHMLDEWSHLDLDDLWWRYGEVDEVQSDVPARVLMTRWLEDILDPWKRLVGA